MRVGRKTRERNEGVSIMMSDVQCVRSSDMVDR
jgi:hypothetical protein